VRLIGLTAIFSALVACGSGIATPANAGTFTYNTYAFSGENVHITDASLGVQNEYGGAGLITLEGTSTIAAYCVDVADWLLGSGTYNTSISPASNPLLSGVSSFTGHAKIADIGALISNGTNAAAVQLAIWETEYGAAVTITPDDSGLQSIASTYLTDLATLWTVPKGMALLELTPANGQINQTLVYMAAVPEPTSMAVLGLGTLMLGYVRKRRQDRRG
jgi:PEP-CTERM motif